MSMKRRQIGRSVLAMLVVTAMVLVTGVALLPTSTARPGMAATTFAPRIGIGWANPPLGCTQLPVQLNSSGTYAVLANSTITNTGQTQLTGDVGLSPGTSVTGFPPGTFTGTENINNASAAGAQANLTLAYNNASARTNCAVSVAGNLGGQTLTPGLYTSTSSLAISSGDLTLSGGGNPNAVFVFQVASTLTTTSGLAVILTNGTQSANVFWQVGSSVTLGTNSTFNGTILAESSITLATGAHLNGEALARTGGITLDNNSVVVPTATTSSAYTATFTESGLTLGMNWSVTLDGVRASSTLTTINFTVANGTYPFTVGAVAGLNATPLSGNVVVNGSDVNTPIAFSALSGSTYAVTFTESGLTAGTSWSVTLNGTLKSSTTLTIVFTKANGTYGYSVGSLAGYTASPASGSLGVNGAAVDKSVAFTSTARATYSVTFTESGLTAGTSWSVTLNGTLKSSTTLTIVFTETNGTYDFTIGTVTGFTATPSSGSVPVSGAAASQTISFTAVPATTYGVTFTESGLPSGTTWSVTFRGIQKNSTSDSIDFVAANGTYKFTVGAVGGYNATPSSGNLSVAGTSATQGISFASTSSSSSSTPLTSEWWFWALIALLVLAIIIGVAIAVTRRPKEPQTPT